MLGPNAIAARFVLAVGAVYVRVCNGQPQPCRCSAQQTMGMGDRICIKFIAAAAPSTFYWGVRCCVRLRAVANRDDVDADEQLHLHVHQVEQSALEYI